MKDANLTATVLVLIACVFAAGVASFANGPVLNYLTADGQLNDSAMIHFRVYRQGDTDANNDAVFIHELDVHYKRDRLGSAKEYGDK